MKLITSHYVRYCDSGIIVVTFNCVDKSVWAHAYNHGYYLFKVITAESTFLNPTNKILEQEIKIPELENLTGYVRSDYQDGDQIVFLLIPFKLLV